METVRWEMSALSAAQLEADLLVATDDRHSPFLDGRGPDPRALHPYGAAVLG